MLDRRYDPQLPYRHVDYGRMSEKKQNKRSPDQQFNTIGETIKRLAYPWFCVGFYRDDHISGQYIRKRPGLQQLLRDIEAGLITIDLIAVDTYERLGRADEIAELRRKLFVDHGILVVAADNNFADPTGVVGKAVGMVEQIRSTENTRVSSHNVCRGKLDAARLKFWPGGPPPFGYKLKPVIDESVSPPDIHNTLELEPRQAAAQKLAFERAAETGHGDTRLSRWWNSSADIPDEFKPISAFTMGYRLTSLIYVGDLKWGENQTGIVNDTRVVEPNPNGPEVIKDFCQPVVDRDLFDRVQELKNARSRAILEARSRAADDGPTKLIAPQSRGLVLKNILSGLLRCVDCKCSLRPSPSGRKSKAGKTYNYYLCPRHLDGACPNGKYFPEEQLREAVISRLRTRLFPLAGQDGQLPPWFTGLLQLVHADLYRYRSNEPDRAMLREQELEALNQKLAGWRLTLADTNISPSLRKDITLDYEQAKERIAKLEHEQDGDVALDGYVKQSFDPQAVVRALGRLHQVLAAYNPTLVNLELSKHIDWIECAADGRVEMRGTCLGLFGGAVELLTREQVRTDESRPTSNGFSLAKPRRRGRLRLPNLTAEAQGTCHDVETALDPNRFAGVPDHFFWQETFVVTEKECWAEEHAAEVARERLKKKSIDVLAAEFGKTPPTIRSAIRHAVEADPSLAELLPKKVSHGRWEEKHAAEVAALAQERASQSLLSISGRATRRSAPR